VKRFLVFVLAILTIVALAVPPVSAARPEKKYPVTFNGHPVTFDAEVQNINGSTFVPFRAIFEKMGASIEWDGATQTITATRGNTTVKLSIGSTTAYVNGAAKELPGAPFIDPNSSRTMVPLRFVGEAFGAEVKYDEATTAISIIDKNWPPRGGTLNLALWNKPDGKFNSVMANDTYTSYVYGMIVDGLWRYDETYTPVPALAESWEWSEGDTKLTIYLRKGVKFHDGVEMTAKDVIFTYKSMWHPKYVGPRNSGWDKILGYAEYKAGQKGETKANFDAGIVTPEPVEGLYAVDDYTVVFKLSEPDAIFVLAQLPYGILPYHKYKDVKVQDWGTAQDPNNSHPIGTGAFKVKEFVEGSYYLLEANDDYWAGRPYVDQVLWRVVAPDVAVGEMQNGKLDFFEINVTELESYKAMSHVGIVEYPTTFHQMMGYNYRQGPTAEKAVRHAINYAIDRQLIINTLKQNHASMQYTPISPMTWAFTEDVEKYAFDPEKSKQLLDEAGWKVGADGIRVKDGQRLHLRLIYPNTGNQVRIRTAPVVQEMLKKVGIEVELVGLDWTSMNQKVNEEYDFDMYFIGWDPGSSDPDQTGLWDKASAVPGGYNASRWYTDKSEQLLAEGRKTADIEKRMEIYAEWQKHWAEESPALILYAETQIMVYNKKVGNFKPGPQGFLWNVEEMYLK
jgi:peptide/nickel transport system substrate-binding protein